MRFITLAHRWMGVVLCLFFAAWFLSGAVLIYHPFPSLSQTDRLANNPSVNFSKIRISPTAVIEVKNNIELDRFRLIDVGGRPTYVLHPQKGPVIVIDGKDGKVAEPISKDTAGYIANHFYNISVLRIDGPIEYDQWIVPNRFDPYRPFYRIPLQDNKETVLYISARTGEVLQKTEGNERAWNYIGAIVHWIYPTFLRKNWAIWDQVVWWISLVGVVTAVAGLLLGIVRLREAKSKNGSGIASPFKGWLRTHHILGLFAGIFILTWIFSGWLSMDHGRLFSKPSPEAIQIKNFRGISIKQAVKQVSLEGLKSLKDFSEIEIFATGGQTFIMTRNSNGMKLFKPQSPDFLSPAKFTVPELIIAVQRAWPDVNIQATQRPDESDIYGQLREGTLPKNTLRVILDDPMQTWIHIDMESGQIVSVMDKSRRLYRWLFNGLHSLDFPGLVNHRPVWDVLILFLLGVGFFFSITAVVVGWKRLFNH